MMEGAPALRQGAHLDSHQCSTARPCAGPVGVSIIAKSPPKGLPSIHEEGEARQLKTNPFPTQSYPTGSAKFNQFPVTNPGMGGWEKKFVTSNAAEETYNL